MKYTRLIIPASLLLASCAPSILSHFARDEGSFNLVSGGGESVGMGTFEETSKGIAVGVYVSRLAPGQHALHIHNTCWTDGAPVPDGRLPNLRAEYSGVGKLELLIPNAYAADFEGKALVIHDKKDQGFTDPDLNVGRGVACGVIRVQARRGQVVAKSLGSPVK